MTGLLLTGTALLVFDAWVIYRPAGFIAAGAVIVAGIVLRARGNG